MEKLMKEKDLLMMVNIKGQKAYKLMKAALGRKDATEWLLKKISSGKYRPI